MLSLIDTDLAWAAGLFEGEGFIVKRRMGQRVYLGVGIEMRDLDIVTRFVDILRDRGITMKDRPSGPKRESQIRLRSRNAKNPKHSDVYVWTTAGHVGRDTYLLLRPWLGERRRLKGDAILAEIAAITEALSGPGLCVECGEIFHIKPYGRTRRYCSELCYSRAKIKRPGQREAARERGRRYRDRQKAARAALVRPAPLVQDL